MFYVYEIRNKLNNKGYVGITSKNLKDRLFDHSQCGTSLKNVICDWGLENFSIRALYCFKEKKDALRMEKLCMKTRDTFFPGGYNLHGSSLYKSTVSKSSKRRRPILCTTTGVMYGSITEASQDLQIPISNIVQVLVGKNKTAYGKSFKYKE